MKLSERATTESASASKCLWAGRCARHCKMKLSRHDVVVVAHDPPVDGVFPGSELGRGHSDVSCGFSWERCEFLFLSFAVFLQRQSSETRLLREVELDAFR